MSMGDDHTCRLVGKGTIHIRMYDETLRELKEMGYIPHITKNLISVGDQEVKGLKETLREGVLKMFSGSLVVLKDIKCNVYYLMGSVVQDSWMVILLDRGTVSIDKLA